MEKFINWLKSKLKLAPKAEAPKPGEVVIINPKPQEKLDLIGTFLKCADKYNGLKETHGQNRSPEIDKIILAQGGELGDPYCLYGVQQVMDDTEEEVLGLKFDLPKGGSTQKFWERTKEEYKINYPKRGALCVMQDKENPHRGHIFIVTSKADPSGIMGSFEFNTNHYGDRDGGNCGYFKRHIGGDRKKRVLGYIDIERAAKYVSKETA